MGPQTAYPVPQEETDRLQELESYDILDTAPEQIYDDLVFLASQVCGTEIAAISLIDEDRQWFKAKCGIEDTETAREDAFCAHAIVQPEDTFIVEDAVQDDRFRENPYVQGDPNIRFYAGAPLVTPDGRALGTICAIDDEPGRLSETQERALEALSNMVMTQLELRRRSRELRSTKDELEEMTEELKRSNEELDRFASVVTHELKDPLTQVVSNLDLLDLTVDDELDDEASELLEDAITGGERMENLIQDLLRYSRAGGSDGERQRVAMDGVADQVRDELRRKIESADAEVTCEDLPEVWGDPSLLRQCLQNLVGNALKYSGDEPAQIHVGVEDAGDAWRFTVEDDGIGIPEDEQDELFEVFRRASNTGDRSGTGVGLALCYRIVQRHGGEIGVESTVGEGSTFWFTLPKREPDHDDERRGR